MVEAKLLLLERSTGRSLSCVVTGSSSDEGATLSMSLPGMGEVVVEGYDYEEAFQSLRSQLDDEGRLLLCNRFRRDALMTSLSRQMSGGPSCYLVKPRTELEPGSMVKCLGPADSSAVVTRAEADEFLEKWKSWFEKPVLIQWIQRLMN